MTAALRDWIVIFDFDGTVSPADMGHVILDAMSTPEWREVDERWDRREIPTSGRARAQFAPVVPDPEKLNRLIDQHAVDPEFPALVRELQAMGAVVRIASDGFDVYVKRMLGAAGLSDLPVDVNHLDMSGGTVTVEFPQENDGCGHCGMCKRLPVRRAREDGRLAAYVGDGLSDTCAAGEADLLFAKGRFADHCNAHGIPYHAFDNLSDVGAWIAQHVSDLPGRPAS